MADIRTIVGYMKSLKKGFDKDLFQSQINDLSYIVDSYNLCYNDFHTLFKLWLNLNIPITKWTSFGVCLVPSDEILERTVNYAFQWILANYGKQSNFARIGFLLDWLTASMECNCIDFNALDSGYELFYSMLSIEVLTPHVMKLVYTLTKPSDVTRKRVLELLESARKREGKKNMYRQLQVLLGLFKSYKPECVPEDIPAISIHSAFKKLNTVLLDRFKRIQEHRRCSNIERKHLLWVNPINAERRKNKKADPLVPDMQICNIGSKQYEKSKSQKDFFDFTEPVSLVHHSLQQNVCRPARLRALLCNETGITLLAVASHLDHSFLSHDLHHLLNGCFLEISMHSYSEKRDLLHRLALLQRTLMQGIPVITRFLAQYLPLWNERDYFPEILKLIEWISLDSPDYLDYIVKPLTRIYHRAQPMEQCAIVNSLTTMYTNLVYASTRKTQYFMGANSSQINYEPLLGKLATEISEMCNKGLQASPEDMRVVYSSVWSAECMSLTEARYVKRPGSLPAMLTLAVPLLSISAGLIDKMAALMMTYQKIFSRLKANNKHNYKEYPLQIEMLQRYITDMVCCLYTEEALTKRNTGLIFDGLNPQTVAKLDHSIPLVDSKLSIRNHLAFAPYTYAELQDVDDRDANNKIWFDVVVDQQFIHLAKFLKKNINELYFN